MMFFARTEGTASVHTEAQAFVAAFVRRIETGLLPGTSPNRCRYVVTRHNRDGLAFRATNWLTAFNVGLNDVELAVGSDGRVRYTIRYRQWAAYALVGSGAFGLVFIGFLLIFDIRGYIARHMASMIPGLSIEQNVAVAWAMALFWGFAWPWILIALHKKPLRRLMERLVAEVDATGMRGVRSPQ